MKDVLVEINVLLDDLQMKSEQKADFESSVKSLEHQIQAIKGKIKTLVARELNK